MRHNILSSLPDPDTLRSKLDKLDLIVAITTTWSPTADYADIVRRSPRPCPGKAFWPPSWG